MNDDALHLLAFEFFRVFSRFEYALKAAGFHKGTGPAIANWDLFATEIEASITEIHPGSMAEAITFLLAEPPKKLRTILVFETHTSDSAILSRV